VCKGRYRERDTKVIVAAAVVVTMWQDIQEEKVKIDKRGGGVSDEERAEFAGQGKWYL
jgi:hypothetical protein